MRRAHVTGVLMPCKLQSDLCPLDDELLVKKKSCITNSRFANIGDQIGEKKMPHKIAIARALADEIAIVANVDFDLVGARGVHLAMHMLDRRSAAILQTLQF